MDVNVIASTKDSFMVRFSDASSGVNFNVGIDIPVIDKWKLQSNQLLSTATILADEILINHDHSQPLRPEYLYSLANTKESLETTIEQIRATRP